MTVATTARKAILAGNGINTNFGFNFAVRSAADLQVYYTDANGVQTLLAANLYSVALNPVPNGQLWAQGGSVTYPLAGAAIAGGTELTVARNVPLTQTSTLINQGGYSPQTVEQMADLLAMAMQQVNEIIARSLTIPISSSANTALPAPQANALLGWDAAGANVINIAAAGAIPLPLGVGQGGTGAANTSAKGSLLLGNAGTYSALLVGANGTVLVADSTQPLGAKWSQILAANIAANAVGAAALAGSALGCSMINGTIVPSQNGTQLTVAIKTLAGADPSAADPVYILFRNATAKTGDYTVATITAANSITTTVGGSFGVANGIPFRLWLAAFLDAGPTVRLALVNCVTSSANAGTGRLVTNIFGLAQFGIASSTQIGAGSTLTATFYSAGAAVASKAYTVLGNLGYEAGLAVAGTFGVDQTRTDLFRAGMTLPGQPVQDAIVWSNGGTGTGTGGVTNTDAIPQNTYGDQYASQAITPTSAANVLEVEGKAGVSVAVAAARCFAFLFQDAVANAIAVSSLMNGGDQFVGTVGVRSRILAQTTSATTLKLRLAQDSGNTLTYNGQAGLRKFGGTYDSFLSIREIQG